MKNPIVIVSLIALAIAAGPAGCSRKNRAEIERVEKETKDKQALETAFKAYDAAVRAHDKEAIRSAMTPENAAEMETREAALAMEMMTKLREANPQLEVLSYDVAGNLGTVRLKGTLDGACDQRNSNIIQPSLSISVSQYKPLLSCIVIIRLLLLLSDAVKVMTRRINAALGSGLAGS